MTDTPKPVEQATATVLPPPGTGTGTSTSAAVQVVVEPTQMRRPWQATIRTGFQALVALATLVPLVIADVYESPDAYPAVVAQVVLVSGVVARIMANPAVETFLRSFLPFLAAAPTPKPQTGVTALEVCAAITAIGVILALLFGLGWIDNVGSGR